MKLRRIWALLVILFGLLCLGGCAAETYTCSVIGMEETAALEAVRDAVDTSHPWNGCDLRTACLEVLDTETVRGIQVQGTDRHVSHVVIYGRLTSLELTRAETVTGFAAIDSVTAPVVITLEQDETGACRPLDYWEGEAEADWEAEIRARFPKDIREWAGRLCTAEAHTLRAEQDCLDEAVRRWNLDAVSMADRLLDSLVEAYPEGMDPLEFLSTHPETWRELQVLGLHTLRCAFSRFLEGAGSGAESTVLAAVCSDLTMITDDYLDEQPLYDERWFRSFLSSAGFYLRRDGEQEMRRTTRGCGWPWKWPARHSGNSAEKCLDKSGR